MQCGGCGVHLAGVDDLYFYGKTSKILHLSLRPELRALLSGSGALSLTEKSGDGPGSHRNSKTNERVVTCVRCGQPVGKEQPYGPLNTNFVAFSKEKVVVFGVRLRKKDKWADARLQGPLQKIQVLSDSDFRGNPPPTGPLQAPAPPLRWASELQDFDWRGITATIPRPYQVTTRGIVARLLHSRTYAPHAHRGVDSRTTTDGACDPREGLRQEQRMARDFSYWPWLSLESPSDFCGCTFLPCAHLGFGSRALRNEMPRMSHRASGCRLLWPSFSTLSAPASRE